MRDEDYMTGSITLCNETSFHTTGSGLFSFLWEGFNGLAGPHEEANITQVAVLRIVISSPVAQARSTSQSTGVSSSRWDAVIMPRTDLGKRLHDLRAKAVAAGMKLLSEEEVLKEVKYRRGELEDNEKDLC